MASRNKSVKDLSCSRAINFSLFIKSGSILKETCFLSIVGTLRGEVIRTLTKIYHATLQHFLDIIV